MVGEGCEMTTSIANDLALAVRTVRGAKAVRIRKLIRVQIRTDNFIKAGESPYRALGKIDGACSLPVHLVRGCQNLAFNRKAGKKNKSIIQPGNPDRSFAKLGVPGHRATFRIKSRQSLDDHAQAVDQALKVVHWLYE